MAYEQESASAFMTGGPTALMPDTLRLRRDPLSVSAASPTVVILVQRLRDATYAVIMPLGFLPGKGFYRSRQHVDATHAWRREWAHQSCATTLELAGSC